MKNKLKIFGALLECPAKDRDQNCCINFLLNSNLELAWKNVKELNSLTSYSLLENCRECYKQKILKTDSDKVRGNS